MSADEAHARLGQVLTWAELEFDSPKVARLRDLLMSAQLVLDQLQRSTST